MENFEYEIALSFAGDNKLDRIREIAENLQQRLNNQKIFFYEWYQAELAGMDGSTRIQNIYRQKSRLVVACICQRYGEKTWTQDEWRAILSLERQLKDDRSRYRLLLIRFDDGEVDGIFDTAVVPDVRNWSTDDIAELIIQRHELTLDRSTSDESRAAEKKMPDQATTELHPDRDQIGGNWKALLVESGADDIVARENRRDGETRSIAWDQIHRADRIDRASILSNLIPEGIGTDDRLLVVLNEPELAALPWLSTARHGNNAPMTIEPIACNRPVIPLVDELYIVNPMLVIPEVETNIVTELHYQEVQEVLRAGLGLEGRLARVKTWSALETGIRRDLPDLIFISAELDGEQFVFGDNMEDAGSLGSLMELIRDSKLSPVIIMSLQTSEVSASAAQSIMQLVNHCSLLWIQFGRSGVLRGDNGPYSRCVENLEAVLIGDSGNQDSVVETKSSTSVDLSHRINEVCRKDDRVEHILLLGEYPVRARRFLDGEKQLRAELIRVMLGRSGLKREISDKLNRSQNFRDKKSLLICVCGAQSAAPFALPAQVEQHFYWETEKKEIPVLNWFCDLTFNLSEEHTHSQGEDSLENYAIAYFDRALSNAFTNQGGIRQSIETIAASKGFHGSPYCAFFNLHITVEESLFETNDWKQPAGVWLRALHKILSEDYADQIPEHCALVAFVCIELPESFESRANDIFSVAENIFNKSAPSSLDQQMEYMLLEADCVLGGLSTRELKVFLTKNDYWLASLKDAQRFDAATTERLAEWSRDKTRGRFENLVRLLWRSLQEDFTAFFGEVGKDGGD